MKSIWQRSYDLYQLKRSYRYLLAGFLLPGLIAGFLLVADRGYDAQIARGLTPGAPISEPGSVAFLCQFLALAFGAGLIGMTLGALLLCLVLAALRRLPFRDAVRAVFLSHYPRDWFRIEKPGSE